MKQLIAALVAGLFATAVFAQTTAPAAGTMTKKAAHHAHKMHHKAKAAAAAASK